MTLTCKFIFFLVPMLIVTCELW